MLFFFFQAEDGIRDKLVTGVQTCALPIFPGRASGSTRSSQLQVADAAEGSRADDDAEPDLRGEVEDDNGAGEFPQAVDVEGDPCGDEDDRGDQCRGLLAHFTAPLPLATASPPVRPVQSKTGWSRSPAGRGVRFR